VSAGRPQPPPTFTNPPQPPRKSAREEAIAWLKAIGVALLIWIVLRSYLVEAFRIPSGSMENTLLTGDFLFVDKAVFGGELEIPLIGTHFGRLPSFGSPQRDEVVVFRSVEDSTPNLNIVKRLIGMPGDTLQMVHDTIIRNRQRLEEPYALHTALTSARTPTTTIRQPTTGARSSCRRSTTGSWGTIATNPTTAATGGSCRALTSGDGRCSSI